MSSQIIRIHRYAVVMALSWTALIAGAFLWFYSQQRENVLAVARAEARMALEKDALYRRWATGHGGVYVPVDSGTPPNPYLSHVPERDISTPSGRKLTLLNPAYMTRQVFELAGSLRSMVRAHITSLDPIRPENAPDAWETVALRSFDRGAREYSEVLTVGGVQYMRLMQPFLSESGCFKCHLRKGHQVGAARGGVSVMVPLKVVSGYSSRLVQGTALLYLSLWLVGLGMIRGGKRALSRSVKALEESEERYRTVADYTADWEYWLAPDGTFRYMSPSCREACGYSQEEFYRDPELMLRVIHPEDRGCYLEHVKSEQEADFSAPVDMRIVTRNGETRWISHVCRTVFTSEGKVNGRRASNRDITYRKQVESAIVHSEEKFSKVFYNAPVMMSISTIDNGIYLDVNQKFVELSGISRSEVVGKTASEAGWLSVDQRALLLGELKHRGAISGLELHPKARDGRSLTCLYCGELINVEGEQRLLLIALDVTEQRKLEEQLRHSQKLEAVGQLAGGIAHDFNNILLVIAGYASLLQAEMVRDTPEMEKVNQILAASERAASLTRSLLTFSRREEVKAGPADLNRIVRHVEQFLRMIIGEDVQVATSLQDGHIPVLVDSGQFGQVLINLATNARDAMEQGGTLSITTSICDADASLLCACSPGKVALVTVSDTGKGMNEETRRKIFEPFFTTKDAGKGTGLGLSIAYGIVKQHGGCIEVSSHPGKGSTFHIYLPLAQSRESLGEKSPQTAPLPKGTETLLLAEDDCFVRELMRAMLEEQGYTVMVAASGHDAVEKFRGHREKVRLVLMDLVMPEKSGKDAAREIREMAPEANILFMSGYTSDLIRSRGLLEPEGDLLMKPVSQQELAWKVREVLDRKMHEVKRHRINTGPTRRETC